MTTSTPTLKEFKREFETRLQDGRSTLNSMKGRLEKEAGGIRDDLRLRIDEIENSFARLEQRAGELSDEAQESLEQKKDELEKHWRRAIDKLGDVVSRVAVRKTEQTSA